MENFKKKHGKKITLVCFVIMWVLAIYPFVYWLPRPELTLMQVAHHFWYFIPMWIAMFVVAYVFDGSNDIHV